MNKIQSQGKGGGIVVRDGRWVMLCGQQGLPIRLLDAHDREIPVPEAARDVQRVMGLGEEEDNNVNQNN